MIPNTLIQKWAQLATRYPLPNAALDLADVIAQRERCYHPPLPRAPRRGETRQRRERAEKRRLFGRAAHTRKTWQAFCRVLRNGNTEIPFVQLIKLSKRIAGQSAR